MDIRNVFISISWTINFQELLISIGTLDQIPSFVQCIYVCLSPLYIFTSFLTLGFHNHFFQIWYMIVGFFGQNVVRLNTPLRFLPYFSNPLFVFFLHSRMIHELLVMFHMWYLF
jgi:hypothetical protein